jgi:hypothetical protein
MGKNSSKKEVPARTPSALAKHWDDLIRVVAIGDGLAGETASFWSRWANLRPRSGFVYWRRHQWSTAEDVAEIDQRNAQASKWDPHAFHLVDDWNKGALEFWIAVDLAINHAVSTRPHYGDEILPATQWGLTRTVTLMRDVRSCFPEIGGFMPPPLKYVEQFYNPARRNLIETIELVKSLLYLGVGGGRVDNALRGSSRPDSTRGGAVDAGGSDAKRRKPPRSGRAKGKGNSTEAQQLAWAIAASQNCEATYEELAEIIGEPRATLHASKRVRDAKERALAEKLAERVEGYRSKQEPEEDDDERSDEPSEPGIADIEDRDSDRDGGTWIEEQA